MKYFKCVKTGQVYAYEADGSQDHLISESLVQMGQDEIYRHENQAVSVVQRRRDIFARLEAVDAASARPLRAILVGSATDEDRARLTELDEQAAALRAELVAMESPPAA